MNENFTIENIIERLRNLEFPDMLKNFFGKISIGAKSLGQATTRQLL